ncbi:hypothetical protein FNH09_18330 [Streptomyces adustus]|uniref:Uncharacterized protein n=1 Tax=Streptomyces adustus TaxID=1609272 RepID=A0A5N8VGN6_9ACTN|nr:hypothetical protein [Streptomyces adustus]MPY33145.1 hypothetical protein [Streptomyces adustus]
MNEADKERLAEMARGHYIHVASESLGQSAPVILRNFLPRLKEIHRAVDYESINVALTVFYRTNVDKKPLDHDQAYKVTDAGRLALHNDGVLTVEVGEGGDFWVWKEKYEPAELAHDAVVYHYVPGRVEEFWVNGELGDVPPSVGFARIFGISKFDDLADCLEHYALKLARPSQCRILADLWREEDRIMWKAAPESTMRDSLVQHLVSSLREGNPDIRPESNVDDRNPVDIEVKWENSNRIGLIEIKWLGLSGVLGDKPRITGRHTESRAHEGLRQIAEYLDRTRDRAATYDRRGFLFIFDGRRARVKADSRTLSYQDAWKYQDAHIVFDRDLLGRSDIADPIRCFCEPRIGRASSPSRA